MIIKIIFLAILAGILYPTKELRKARLKWNERI